MANDVPAREAMEFDVVIVGAGPAGLAAAIRLKQLSPEIGVVAAHTPKLANSNQPTTMLRQPSAKTSVMVCSWLFHLPERTRGVGIGWLAGFVAGNGLRLRGSPFAPHMGLTFAERKATLFIAHGGADGNMEGA